MSVVQTRFKAIEQPYSTDVLNLVLARGYVTKLLGNTADANYLQRYQSDFYAEFKAVAATASLYEAASPT